MKKYKKFLNVLLVSTLILPGFALKASASEDTGIKRLHGRTRVETSIEVSNEVYADKSTENVVLAGYHGEVDALTGTLLASSKNAPLLLIDQFDDSIENELKRLGVKNVYLLGEKQVISQTLEKELEAANLNVIRIAGRDRWDTAVAVAEESGRKKDHVFLTNDGRSGSLADALAAGPVSGRDEDPILLTSKDKLPKQTLSVIKKLGVKKVTIIGGAGVVSNQVKKELENNDIKADRIAGANRWETAEKIAENYFKDSKKAILANDGRIGNFADALMGGYLGAKENVPMLLTESHQLNKNTENYLESNSIFTYLLGGESVITKENLNDIQKVMQENINVRKASDAVAKAEKSKTQVDVDVAKKSVNKLIDNKIKIELEKRLKLVQSEINKIAKDLTNAKTAKKAAIATEVVAKDYILNKTAYEAKVSEVQKTIDALSTIEAVQNYDIQAQFIDIKEVVNILKEVEDRIEDINSMWEKYQPRSNKVEYLEKPQTVYPYSIGELTDETLNNALDMTNFIRYIAYLPNNIILDNEFNIEAQAASIVNAVNNNLTHYPEKPENMDEKLYLHGKLGAATSNIGAGYTSIIHSINDGYMNDGDSSNIDSVGHRRWILSPNLKQVGFGYTGSSNDHRSYTAMKVIGEYSNTPYPDDYISWPSREAMPIEHFSSDFPWSVSLNQDKYDLTKLDKIKVELIRENDSKKWSFSKESSDGYFNIDTNNYGYLPSTIIFRPEEQPDYKVGDQYTLVISNIYNLDGSIEEVSFETIFFELED